jgi:hypothetical protein
MKTLSRSMMLTLSVVASFIMVLGIESSHAAWKCDSGKITFAGVYPDLAEETTQTSSYLIQYICDADPDRTRQYLLSTDVGDSGYATVLTAVSLGQKVKIQTAGTGGWNSLVERINLVIP